MTFARPKAVATQARDREGLIRGVVVAWCLGCVWQVTETQQLFGEHVNED